MHTLETVQNCTVYSIIAQQLTLNNKGQYLDNGNVYNVFNIHNVYNMYIIYVQIHTCPILPQ